MRALFLIQLFSKYFYLDALCNDFKNDPCNSTADLSEIIATDDFLCVSPFVSNSELNKE
jgi:hypothetical protein